MHGILINFKKILGQYPDLHEAGDVIEMALTNTLIHNTPSVCEFELNTSRDKPSFFVIYSKVNEYDIGCEYTFKRKGECPRYECRTCRSLCDKDSKLRNSQEKAAAVTISINVIKEVKKSTHHPQCRVEFLGTALARSQKNAAIVFRSQYGGTCKQVYDKHTKVLVSSSDCVTAYDIAHGFQPFQQANSALKKSGKRKGAMIQSNVNVGRSDVIEKLSTRIVKSTPLDATDDYFLIGQDESAGVVVLGSRFLVERFFRSKKAMSDGTFKMAPKGYKQSYMMWFVAEGICKGESVERSKAMLSINFLLKGKSQATYASAFKILDEYRRRENIPEPSFEEYITDDEPAVRNAFAEQYPNTIFSLCFFHHNQNVVKTLAQHKLSNFIRKCKTDEQLWFYSKFKQILMIPLLPLNEIIPAFKSLKSSLLGYIESQFTNAFEIDQFTKCFETLEERYFSNEEKLKLICKHKKNMRCTNLIESTHCAFNKSDIIPKHGTVANFIEAMQTTDLQYRAEVIAFEEKGVAVLPKKKNRYVKQQAVISECNAKFDKKEIGVGEFLKKCSEAMIHEKYFKLIEAATKRFEKLEPNDDQDSDIDEHIMAIFATSESTHGRVRKLCSKYFGEEWLN